MSARYRAVLRWMLRRRLLVPLALALLLGAAYWLLASQGARQIGPLGPAGPAVGLEPVAIASRAIKPRLVFGGVTSRCAHYAYLRQAATLLEARLPGTVVTHVETRGSLENMSGLARGQFDLAFASQDEFYRAYHGLAAWQGQRFEKLRILWSFFAGPVAYLVRDDSGVVDLAGLAGQPFNPGERYSDVERETRRLLPALGIQPLWFDASTEETLTALAERKIVGFAQPLPPGAPDAAVLQALRTTRLRALSWSADRLATVRETFPDHRLGEIPVGTFQAEWNRQPIPTWMLTFGVATTADTSDDLAYFIVKIVDQAAERLARAYPAVEGVDIARLTIARATTPLHFGAYRYYRERGLTVPYEITPPEAACWLICDNR